MHTFTHLFISTYMHLPLENLRFRASNGERNVIFVPVDLKTRSGRDEEDGVVAPNILLRNRL